MEMRNKSRFIDDLMSGQLALLGTPGTGRSSAVAEEDLVSTMRRLNFHTSDEIEGVRIGGAHTLPSSKKSGYGYLLDMSIHSLTEERSVSLHKQAEEVTKSLKRVESLTESDLWLTDI